MAIIHQKVFKILKACGKGTLFIIFIPVSLLLMALSFFVIPHVGQLVTTLIIWISVAIIPSCLIGFTLYWILGLLKISDYFRYRVCTSIAIFGTLTIFSIVLYSAHTKGGVLNNLVNSGGVMMHWESAPFD